jgi:phosphopentomutase
MSIPEEKVRAVQFLLAKGIPKRRIALLTDVSCGTVNNIATNRYNYTKVSVRKNYPVPGKTDTCPTCGGKVAIPCLACFLRRNPTVTHRPNTVEITGMIGYICKHIKCGYLTVTGHWDMQGDGLRVFQNKKKAIARLDNQPHTSVIRLTSFTEGEIVHKNY